MGRQHFRHARRCTLCFCEYRTVKQLLSCLVSCTIASPMEPINTHDLLYSCRLEGPVFALVNPFRPGNLRFDDDSFVKYLEVPLLPS